REARRRIDRALHERRAPGPQRDRGPAVNRLTLQLALAGALIAGASPVFAAGPAKASPAQAAYNQERARCLRGESGQARETCLREAGAAYDEARRGQLANAPGADLAGN